MAYQSIQSAAFIYGPQYHHLEFLGSLCSFLDIPLVVTDPHVAKLATKYFPMVVVFEQDYHDISRYVLANYPYILSCLSKASLKSIFFLSEKMQRKHLTSIWCPHPSILNEAELLSEEAFAKEHALLIEGDKLFEGYVVDRVFPPRMPILRVGPIRLTLYDKNKHFYEKLLIQDLKKPLNKQNATIVFAPTLEQKHDFHLSVLKHLLENLPEHVNLIVLLDAKYPIEFSMHLSKLAKDHADHERIFFLDHMPFTCALLDLADVFLGDFSSIAFDFLFFDKPLFLLDSKRFAFQDLSSLGIVLGERALSGLYSLILEGDSHKQTSLFEERKHHFMSYFTSSIATEHLRDHVDSVFRQIQFQTS